MFHKVLFHKDYIHLICLFLDIKDIFSRICLLSSMHYKLLTSNKDSLRLIKKCLSYDFGNILSLFNIKFDNIKNIHKFYDNWNYLIECATKSLDKIESTICNKFITDDKINGTSRYYPHKHDGDDYDIRILFLFQRFGCIYHWFEKVRYSKI